MCLRIGDLSSVFVTSKFLFVNTIGIAANNSIMAKLQPYVFLFIEL